MLHVHLPVLVIVTERSKAEVERCAQNMVTIGNVQRAREQLERDNVLALTGAPGEGKSTLAYLILNDFLKEGWKVYVLKSPEEFFQLHIHSRTIVFFNDIFGTIQFDPNELRRWKPVLEDVNKRLQCSRDPRFLVLFTSRDYVLQEAIVQLEKFQTSLISCSKTFNITINATSRSEKKNIFKSHQNKRPKKGHISDKDIDKLVDLAFPYGFPSICLLFFSLDITSGSPDDFFGNPKMFLDATITANWQDIYKRAAYCLLIFEEGRLDVSKLVLSKKPTTEQ